MILRLLLRTENLPHGSLFDFHFVPYTRSATEARSSKFLWLAEWRTFIETGFFLDQGAIALMRSVKASRSKS